MNSRFLTLAVGAPAVLCAAPLLAGGAGGRTHNSLTWEAVGQNGPRVRSQYKEYVGHPVIQQRFRLEVTGAPPGVTLQVQLNDRDLFAIPAGGEGSAFVEHTLRSPAGPDGRPAPSRRIETGDVLRVYNVAAGVDVTAVYQFVPGP